MYRCKFCDKAYEYPSSLARHISFKHSGMYVQQQQQQQDTTDDAFVQQQNTTDDTFTQQQQQKQQQQQAMGDAFVQQQTMDDACVQQQQFTMDNAVVHQQQQQQQPKDDTFALKHPFTAILSGPTSSGKTFLLTNILQNVDRLCEPTPQRIVWLYKRWQPLYDIIKKTVFPIVEFEQGIPLDLESDSYFDPNVRNMIVLDDLMSTASKDPKINDLFTEGSHHRNLSVVVLNQNLYFGRDPTQRRNCQYMILFNNPIDKLQVMTLAKQMYPGNSNYFMKKFNEAVTVPFGHLLIDLKATTPERLRLRGNIFTNIKPLSNVNNDANDESLYPKLPETQQDGAGYVTTVPPHWIKNKETQSGTGVSKNDDAAIEMRFRNESQRVWKNLFLPEILAEVADDINQRTENYLKKGVSYEEANKMAYNDHVSAMRDLILQRYMKYIMDGNMITNDILHDTIMKKTRDIQNSENVGEIQAFHRACRASLRLMRFILPTVKT